MNELSCYLQEVFSRETEQEFPQWGRNYQDGVQVARRSLNESDISGD